MLPENISPLPLLYLVLIVVMQCDGRPKLKWPGKYSADVIKYSILSGRVQDMTYWRSIYNSRIEYNDGAVNSYVIGRGKRYHKTYTPYEVHPETLNENEMNIMTCHKLDDDEEYKVKGPEDIIPGFSHIQYCKFEEIGKETLLDQDCIKFYLEATYEDLKEKATLWAMYNETSHNWLPHWLCACSNLETSIKHNINDDAVTKNLLFMNHHKKKHVDHVFNAFKTKFGRSYADLKEHAMRRNIFLKTMRLIRETNLSKQTYKLAVNHLADLTPRELKMYKSLKPRNPDVKSTHPFPYTSNILKDMLKELPEEYDARSEGLVAPVQDQGSCGSCWSFATTAAAEGALARKAGKLINVANQALIDCAWEFGAQGCEGGHDNEAYKWMMKYGLPTIADYGTYREKVDYCTIENMDQYNLTKVRGFVDVTSNSVEALKVALYHHGPVTVYIDASDALMAYSYGIFFDTLCESELDSMNHAVTLVGYGKQHNETFWIVKNSWGIQWGMGGYIHILAKNNNCGIMTRPSYVLI